MKLQAVRSDNLQLVTEVLESLNDLSAEDSAAAELAGILQEPHFQVTLKLSSHFILTLRALGGRRDGQADSLDDPFVGGHVRGVCG